MASGKKKAQQVASEEAWQAMRAELNELRGKLLEARCNEDRDGAIIKRLRFENAQLLDEVRALRAAQKNARAA